MVSAAEHPVATCTAVPFSFRGGVIGQMMKGAPLEEGEKVELAGVACLVGRLFGYPSDLRLTDRRLSLVVPRQFWRNRLITIPAGALLEVTVVGSIPGISRGPWIRLRYRTENGDDTIDLRPDGECIANEPDEIGNEVIEEFTLDAGEFAEVLRTWLNAHPAR